MSSIPNKADQTKKGLNDPFAKRDQNKPSSAASAASNQKANLNTKQKINMLNSRQKLAEQLLSGEAEVEVPKHSEQTAEKKAPPKFKRPGMKSENDPNGDKKPKVNLDDLLDNYEKHELPEADLNKISSQDVVAETQKAPISSENLRSFNPNKDFEVEKQGMESPAAETEKGNKSNLFGNQEETDLTIGKSPEKNLEKNKIDAQINSQNNKKAATEFEPLNTNLVSGNQERIDMVFNNEEAEEHNTTSHMNLNPSENTFDEINLTSNNENTNTSKFKGIGSTTSINPKNANFEEDGGFSNNLFESTTSHTKNFFENLSAANNQNDLNNNNSNNNLINNNNNNNNSLNYSNAVINLGSEKTIGASHSNNNLTINPNTNNNSEKDLLGVNAKQADNIDFHINANQHENKSSNTNSENNQTSQGEDNLSIPEINCKSIELTNENFTNEKKHSTNSSNMNLNNQSNGNYQDIKEISGEANNFFSSLQDENAAKKSSYYTNKAISVTNFEEASSSKQANKSSKNIKDFSENFNEKEILSSVVSEEKEDNNASDFNKGNKIEKYASEPNEIINENHVESGFFSEKHRIQILESEINNLRKIISEYKRKEIEENESMLKLEIVNLRNIVKAKSSENELLQSENKNLKNHVKMLQENIEIYFSGENGSNFVDKVESKEPKKNETEAKQEDKVKEELNKEVTDTKHELKEHKTELTEKPSSIFDSEPTRNTNAFSDSNVSSTIFNSNSTQNTTLDSASLKKNKIPENTQRKKAGPVVANPPPFKMQNKNAINFSNPSALFESTSSQSTGNSTGLFD